MKRFLVCGLWIPMVAALVVMSIAGPMALAADAPPPPPPVTQELGYTQAQLAFKIATLLGFSGGDSTDAMNFLKNHVPPAVPLGGRRQAEAAHAGKAGEFAGFFIAVLLGQLRDLEGQLAVRAGTGGVILVVVGAGHWAQN